MLELFGISRKRGGGMRSDVQDVNVRSWKMRLRMLLGVVKGTRRIGKTKVRNSKEFASVVELKRSNQAQSDCCLE